MWFTATNGAGRISKVVVAKGVDYSILSGRADAENRAVIVHTAQVRCSVERTIDVDQRRLRVLAIVLRGTKLVQAR